MSGGKPISMTYNLIVGAIAGVINVLLTCPLWTICTQIMMMGRKKPGKDGAPAPKVQVPSVWELGNKIYANEGAAGLWSGVIPSLWLVSNPTVQFFVYEQVRIWADKYIAQPRGMRLNSYEFFFISCIAKAAATYVTYPLQIAQSRLRADKKGAAKGGKRIYDGTLDCLRKIKADDGTLGWYQGINAKLLQTVLTAGFQFMAYEELQYFIIHTIMGVGAQKTLVTAGERTLVKLVKLAACACWLMWSFLYVEQILAVTTGPQQYPLLKALYYIYYYFLANLVKQLRALAQLPISGIQGY